jgi:NADPH:quinone reductase
MVEPGMTALWCPSFGGPDVLRIVTVPRPRPGPGEVLLQVAAAGLNYPDLLSINGSYPIPSLPPFIPGVEGAGMVALCGPGVTRFCPGERVCWQSNDRKGAFAEYLTLPEVVLARVPDRVPLHTAAAVPTVFGTATFALHHRGQLKPGDWVLITGASGGVGKAAVQLALKADARVIALSGDQGKRASLAALGATQVLDADRPDLRAAILDLTEGRGVDLALDMVGGPAFELSVRVMAPYGRVLTIGFTSGILPTARVNVLLVKGISVVGVNYGHYLSSEPEAARAAVDSVLSQIGDGTLSAEIGGSYPLAEASRALFDLLERRVTGKAVLSINSDLD